MWSALPAWSSFCEPCRSYYWAKKPLLFKNGLLVQQPTKGVKITLNNTSLLLLLTEVFEQFKKETKLISSKVADFKGLSLSRSSSIYSLILYFY